MKVDRREDWLDIAKLIGIWLVILGHMSISPVLQDFIFAFHVPLFFFISGYLHNSKKPFRIRIVQDAKSLLWPYFTFYILIWFINFSFFTLIYFIVTGNWNYSLSNNFIKPLNGLFYGVGYDTTTSYMTNMPLWFLISLFFTKTSVSILEKISPSKVFLVCSSFLFLLLCNYFKSLNIDLYLSLDSAMASLPFFVIGLVFRKYHINLKFFNKKLFFAISAFVLFAIVWKLSSINGVVDINSSQTGDSTIIFLLNGFLGIFGILLISHFIEKLNKHWSFLSRNTLIILGIHSVFIISLNYIFLDKKEDWIDIGASIILLFSLILPINFIHRHFKFLITVPEFKAKMDKTKLFRKCNSL